MKTQTRNKGQRQRRSTRKVLRSTSKVNITITKNQETEAIL